MYLLLPYSRKSKTPRQERTASGGGQGIYTKINILYTEKEKAN
jgi:hypothetical protein